MSELAGLFLKYFRRTSLLVKTAILWLKQARSWLSLTRWVWLELCLCPCSGWLEQELQSFGFWVRINTWRQQYCCFFKHHCLWQSVLKTDLRQEGEGNFAAFKSRCPSHSFISHQSRGHSWTTVTLILRCCLVWQERRCLSLALMLLSVSWRHQMLKNSSWSRFEERHFYAVTNSHDRADCRHAHVYVLGFFFSVCHLGQCTRSSLICL